MSTLTMQIWTKSHISNWHVTEPDPVNIYLFKVNNTSTRKRCEICSKLTIPCSKSTIETIEKGVKYVQS